VCGWLSLKSIASMLVDSDNGDAVAVVEIRGWRRILCCGNGLQW
jgi:hypothetical protein